MDPKPAAYDKAEEQRRAASAAVELLAEHLGPDLHRFVDLYEAASFRFLPALIRGLEQPDTAQPPQNLP